MPSCMSDCASLERIGRSVRAFLEPIWAGWHRDWGHELNTGSRGTCVRSSLFLKMVLMQDFEISSDVMSGQPCKLDGSEAFGFFDGRQWQSHAWVETSDGMVIDMTADQFSGVPIIVSAAADTRYRPGIDEATTIRHISANRQRSVAKTLRAWPGADERAHLLARLDVRPPRKPGV